MLTRNPNRTEPEPYVYRTQTKHKTNFKKILRTRTEPNPYHWRTRTWHKPKILGSFSSLLRIQYWQRCTTSVQQKKEHRCTTRHARSSWYLRVVNTDALKLMKPTDTLIQWRTGVICTSTGNKSFQFKIITYYAVKITLLQCTVTAGWAIRRPRGMQNLALAIPKWIGDLAEPTAVWLQ